MSSTVNKNDDSQNTKSPVGLVKKRSNRITIAESILLPVGIFFLGQVLAMVLIFATLPDLFSEEQIDSITTNFVFAALLETISIGLLFWYVSAKKRGLKWLGFVRAKAKDFVLVLPAFGAYFAMAVLAFVVVEALNTGVNLDQEQTVGFENASGMGELALAFVALVILTPIAEEALIRGFMFKGLRQKMKFVPAALLSALVFAVAHLQLNVGIDTFVLGLTLAWLVEKTGNIWPAIMLHMLKNGIAFYALFIY